MFENAPECSKIIQNGKKYLKMSKNKQVILTRVFGDNCTPTVYLPIGFNAYTSYCIINHYLPQDQQSSTTEYSTLQIQILYSHTHVTWRNLDNTSLEPMSIAQNTSVWPEYSLSMCSGKKVVYITSVFCNSVWLWRALKVSFRIIWFWRELKWAKDYWGIGERANAPDKPKPLARGRRYDTVW